MDKWVMFITFLIVGVLELASAVTSKTRVSKWLLGLTALTWLGSAVAVAIKW